ncbi:hypothetical protein, partial [Acidovorax sp. ACV02]|uniref:hypothetical protein n=1 Tax=Acidovorax sp. ACV02 TaxID=2769310 RepID=UPI001CE1CBE7
KRLKKAGSKTIPEPGSVSRLAGSAHRWDELYADGVQGKTTQSRTNCSSIENNPPTRRRAAKPPVANSRASLFCLTESQRVRPTHAADRSAVGRRNQSQ